MIKFATFDIYTADDETPYARVSIVVDKVTCLVSNEKEPNFTYIYLAEGVTEDGNNYGRVKGTMEEVTLRLLAADAPPATREWAPTNYTLPTPGEVL